MQDKDVTEYQESTLSCVNKEATQRQIEALERQIPLETNPMKRKEYELMLKCLLSGKGGVITVPKGVL